ncbi:helix-turn-helix domain-containing protein [Streptomyces hypolithicus]
MRQSTDPTPSATLPSAKERRRLREAKSLTRAQVAAAVGVTRETVRSWEQGRSHPKGRKRQAYAALLAGPDTASPAEVPGGDAPGRSPQGVERNEPEQGDPPNVRRPRRRRGAAPTPTPPQSPAPALPTAPTDAAPAEPTPHEPTPPDSTPPDPTSRPLTPAQAFDALYAQAAPAMQRQAYLLTGRRRVSREAVEHAFHLAWQRWPEVATDRDPAGWIRAAAYEYAMSPWHRLRRVRKRPDEPPVDPGRRALLDALLALPPMHRRTVLLYDGLGLDLPETAAETEASTPAAARRLLNARATLARCLPELARAGTVAEQSAVLHERLAQLAEASPNTRLRPARAVRTGSERKTRFWTRSAMMFTALIVGATSFTVVTAPTRYIPELAPGEAVGGVPVRGGPPALTPEDEELHAMLRAQPMAGPGRLLPVAR